LHEGLGEYDMTMMRAAAGLYGLVSGSILQKGIELKTGFRV
jgi:hypothetical protein